MADPRDSIRARATVIAADDGVRLLRTEDHEWGVDIDGSDAAWTDSEIMARIVYASVPRRTEGAS